MEPNWVNSNVLFLDQETPIKQAVELMVENKISSVPITDEQERVVGIITERDIIRKFTLLDMSDKLTRKVATIMSRPVAFVSLDNLNAQITKLHVERRMRHFPVLQNKDPIKANVIGIVSITDFLKQFIEKEKPIAAATAKIRLGIMAKAPYFKTYVTLFEQLGFQPFAIDDFHKFYREGQGELPNILFDWDGYQSEELKTLIADVRRYKGNCIFATSNLQLVSIFRTHLQDDHQSIAIKPLDISYYTWLMTHKWSESKKK